MYKHFRFAFTLVALLSAVLVFSQEDTEFWFAAPRMLSGHNAKKTANYHLIIYNHSDTVANIKISQPANTGSFSIDQTFSIAKGSVKDVLLAPASQVYPKADSISVPFDVVSKRGIHVVSDVNVQCYYQVTKGNGEAYTLKGSNALGREFVVAMQNKFSNGTTANNSMYENAYSSVSIVASEDNTTVTITPTKSVSSKCNTSSFTITLNRGETYAFHACGSDETDHPIATIIKSDKPIAVTYNDDSVINGKNADAVGEQLAPTVLAGDQYAAVSNKTDCDYLFLIGLSDGTTVTDDAGTSYSLNKGGIKQISLKSKDAIYLKGSSPYQVFQLTSYGGEMGGTILPQISCTGSTNASYTRVNKDGAVIKLVTHKDNRNAISINGKAISSSNFKSIGSSDFVYLSADLKDDLGISDKEIRVSSSKGVFQMGILDYEKKNTATFGFFSNYASSAMVTINETNTNRFTICRNNALNIRVTPVDQSIDLSNAEAEWRDLLDGGKVIESMRNKDVLNIPKVTFDTAAYQVVWKNACGISSFVNIMVGVRDAVVVEETRTACESYTWEGKTYTESGDYYENKKTSSGCDETHILHLTVNKPKKIYDIVETSHVPYVWERTGQQITGKTASYSTPNSNGDCDEYQYNLSLTDIGVITSNSYTWRNQTITTSGTYTDHEVKADGSEYNYKLIIDIVKPEEHPFTIAKCGITVTFSPGNLQYQASTNTWRFASNQWEVLGDDNKNISNSYSGWIDLFGWGTGNNPTQNSSTDSDYAKSLNDLRGSANDWANNHISNSTETEWITLSKDEWEYLFSSRKNASKLIAQGSVNGVNGLIILPDDWSLPSGQTFNSSTVNYTTNVYTASQWAVMQSAGAVFLPCGGWRTSGPTVSKLNEEGYYWSTTGSADGKAYEVKITNTQSVFMNNYRRYSGVSIRLAKYVNKIPHVGIGEFSIETCDGKYTWAAAGKTYTTAGDYTETLIGPNGCDSVVTLHLKVGKKYDIDTFAVACESFDWYGKTYTVSNTYIYNPKTVAGCDSIVRLHLTINKSESSEFTINTCDSYYWEEADEELTASGDYTRVFKTKDGCDRTVTLHLTLGYTYEEDTTVEACDFFMWYGKAYAKSGSYQRKLNKLSTTCDSIKYLNLTIHKSVNKDTVVQACGQFIFDGKTYTKTGNYKFDGKTVAGCDSVFTLKLTIFPEYSIDTTAVECESFTWHGNTYTESGDYVYNPKTIHGCDSITTLHLTINKTTTEEETKTICEGETFVWEGMNCTESKDYTVVLKSKLTGCDSTRILHLRHFPTYTLTAPAVEACDSYTWEGQTYTQTGNYTQTLKTINGCDSIVTLPLTIWQSYNKVDDIVLCEGEPFIWGDVNIPAVKLSDAKDYTYTFSTIHGCDSNVVTRLTVNARYEVSFDATVCENEQYVWEGTTYSFVSSYDLTDTKVLQSIRGCDSVVTMKLHFNPTKMGSFNAEICQGDSYTWNGQKYVSEGSYSQTLKTSLGCDSVVTLHLKVNPVYNISWRDTIIDGDHLTWEGTTYSEEGTYIKTLSTVNGCDSVVTLLLAKNTFDISDLGYEDFCVELDSAGSFVVQINRGFIDYATLVFSDNAHAQGIRDSVIEVHGSNQPIEVRIPMTAHAGKYQVTVSYFFRDRLIHTQVAAFNINFPASVLIQKWNDFIGVQTPQYNGGYDFVSFEWYKNGSLLVGETHSYIYQQLEYGAQYWALLTDTAGLQLYTCPITAEMKDEIGLYPTQVRPRQKMQLHTDLPAKIWIYDSTGKQISEQDYEQGNSELDAPQQQGMYIARILLQDGITERKIKFMVK